MAEPRWWVGETCGQRRALGRGQGDPWAWESCGCLRGAFQLGVHQAWQKGRERLNTQGSARTKPQSPRGCRGRARVGKVGFLGRWVAASLGDSTPGLACCLQAAPRLELRQALLGGPSVISCFESGHPGLTTLPAGTSLTGELAVSVSSKLWQLPRPLYLGPEAWVLGRRSRGQAGQ